MLFGLVVLRYQKFVILIGFCVLKHLDSAHLVRVTHVFVNSSDNVCTILTVYVFTIHIHMTARFSDECVSGALQYKTDAKVRIVFFFFEARLYKSAF